MRQSQIIDAVAGIMLDAIIRHESYIGRKLSAATFRYPGYGASELDNLMLDGIHRYESATGVKLDTVVFTYERPEFGVPVYGCDAAEKPLV